MTTITRHRGRMSIALSFIAALLLALPLYSVRADSNSNLVVQPGTANAVSGNTYVGWSGLWWQFVSSIPATDNPLLDQTGADCTVGQSGSVWFLVGVSTSGRVTRTCTIPSGKILFFPVVNQFAAAEGTVDQM